MTVGQAALLLQGWDNFAILTHRRPDGDTTGSAAALCEALRYLGKTAHVVNNPDITPRFYPYVAEYIMNAPKLEDTGAFRLIAVDTASVSQLPEEQQRLAGHVDLFIDHHKGKGFGKNRLADSGRAACGELIFDLIEELGVPLSRRIALALYLAVSTDTGCFRYSNTSARTHEIAAKLFATGIDSHAVNFEMFELRTKARIAIEAEALSSVEFSPGGGLCVMPISLDMQARAGTITDDLDNISSLPRVISGVKIGITLREETPNEWKISVRTCAPYEADRLCAAHGGGGHPRAGGCQLSGSREEVSEVLKNAVTAMYPDYDRV